MPNKLELGVKAVAVANTERVAAVLKNMLSKITGIGVLANVFEVFVFVG